MILVKPFIKEQAELIIPNAVIDSSKRNWDLIIRDWRRNLHVFDNITSTDEGLHILSQIQQYTHKGPLRKRNNIARGHGTKIQRRSEHKTGTC